MASSAEAARLAENDAIFSTIDTRAEAPVRFLCECGDPWCSEVIRMSRREYAAVRKHPERYVVATTHADASNACRLIVCVAGYAVVEKAEVAGD